MTSFCSFLPGSRPPPPFPASLLAIVSDRQMSLRQTCPRHVDYWLTAGVRWERSRPENWTEGGSLFWEVDQAVSRSRRLEGLLPRRCCYLPGCLKSCAFGIRTKMARWNEIWLSLVPQDSFIRQKARSFGKPIFLEQYISSDYGQPKQVVREHVKNYIAH